MEFDLWSVGRHLWFTLWQSSLTVVFSLLLGGGYAVYQRLRQRSPSRWLLLASAVIVFLPAPIVATGFIALFGQQGWLPLGILYQPGAVVLAHLYYNAPLAYLAITSALAGVSHHTDEAAQTMGATVWQRWCDLYWPQLHGSISGSAAIIFLYCFTSFALPLQLGGSRAQTLEVWLYQQITLWHNYFLAGVVILLQLVILGSVVIWLLRVKPIITQRFTPASTKSFGIQWFLALALMTPLIALGSRLEWVILPSSWLPTLLRSLGLTIGVVLVTVLLAVALRIQQHWSTLLLALSPVTLSFVWLLFLGQSYWSLALAMVLGLFPLTNYLVQSRRHQQPSWFADTARILGASHWQRRILEWHWLGPSIRQATAIGTAFVLGDIAYSSVLTPQAAPTAMQTAVQWISSYHFAQGTLAMSLMLLMILLFQAILYARHS